MLLLPQLKRTESTDPRLANSLRRSVPCLTQGLWAPVRGADQSLPLLISFMI
ncbi:MAG TPA: hypothetical protein VKR82_08875 [Candidatus Acidoferrales bacterium]|nr:hypothetical protein [Candidatus Acidoferrales bacterium]